MYSEVLVLSLTDDVAIESVLTDIPFFSVGIMAIGIFTHFLFVKRINPDIVYLYVSCFFAFIAALLDLCQILVRGESDVSKGTGLNSVSGLINAREIFLSLSVGFAYLFLWALVAKCPKGEESRDDQLHSASWYRWGILGMILQWGTLTASVAIPLLQVVWRIVTSQSQYGVLYVIEATLEIVVSIIFILKLVLNILISPLSPSWLPVKYYTVPTLALILSAAIGAGNLLSFAFSETILGRFLRASELYILIISNLIFSFQAVNSSAGSATRQSTVVISPGVISLNEDKKSEIDPHTFYSAIADGPDVLHIPHSMRGHIGKPYGVASLPSWITPDKSVKGSILPLWDTRKVRSVGEEELLRLPPPIRGRGELFPSSVTISGSIAENTLLSTELRLQGQRYTNLSLSYYTMEGALLEGPHNEAPSSLLNNVGETVISNVLSTQPQSFTSHGSFTSLDEILRQQTELDNSIAALKLLSLEPSPGDDHNSAVTSPTRHASSSHRRASSLSRIHSGQKSESASPLSNFSLSIFPDPPAVELDEATNTPPSRFRMQGAHPPATRDVPHLSSVESSSDDVSASIGLSVTSLIGDLTQRNLEGIEPATATSSLNSKMTLKPMILASSTSLHNSNVGLLSLEYNERPRREPFATLKPLFLGTSTSTPMIRPLRPSSTMIPIGTARKQQLGFPTPPE